MLRYSFNEEEAARAVERAVASVLEEGYRTGDLHRGDGKLVITKEVGDLGAGRVGG